MADNSKIEWTDATWQPVTGCSVVSPGCTNCYAMRVAGTRLQHHPSRAGLTQPSKAGPIWNGEVRLNKDWMTQPLSWKRPRKVFVCAHGDLFHESVPNDWIDFVFAVMALCPQHTFQALTKRAERMAQQIARIGSSIEYLERHARSLGRSLKWNVPSDLPSPLSGKTVGLVKWPLPNVWLGVSAERQNEADERVPHLLATPAAVRFVSCEPLLGPIDLTDISIPQKTGEQSINALVCEEDAEDCGELGSATLDWIIVGGESGPRARPMDLAWARSIIDQCRANAVPVFMKQLGSATGFNLRDRKGADWMEWAADLRVREFPAERNPSDRQI